VRRLLFIVVVLLIFIGIVGGASTYRLVLNAPYLPGDALFPLQLASEQLWGLGFNGDEGARAGTLLTLLARRLDDLTAVQGTPDELTAVTALEHAYTQAVAAVAAVPPSDQQAFQLRLNELTGRILTQLAGLENTEAAAVHGLRAQIEGEMLAAQGAGGAAGSVLTVSQSETAVLTNSPLDDPHTIPFPPGANLMQVHGFFPLTGGHRDLSCSTCHTGDTYSGVPSDCAACHAKDDAHQGNFGNDCAACHTNSAWRKANFNHDTIGTQDCVACHTPPPNHFTGACRACHSDTTNFNVALFDHSLIGNQDCSACHTPPPNHYTEACRACHSDTTNFNVAFFDHSLIGNQDCSACHTPPPNHFTGACRACHTDTTNFRIAFFNHSGIGGTDCSACHAAPANHFSGTCSSCHQDTTNFRNASFNHAGLTNCSGCHQPPANHYTGQCSACHNTTTFSGATFSHSFPINHGGANGQCASCHPGNDTHTYTCFTCHDQQRIIGKHNEEGIGDISNCVRCHASGNEHDGGGEHDGGDGHDGGDDHGDDD